MLGHPFGRLGDCRGRIDLHPPDPDNGCVSFPSPHTASDRKTNCRAGEGSMAFPAAWHIPCPILIRSRVERHHFNFMRRGEVYHELLSERSMQPRAGISR